MSTSLQRKSLPHSCHANYVVNSIRKTLMWQSGFYQLTGIITFNCELRKRAFRKGMP